MAKKQPRRRVSFSRSRFRFRRHSKAKPSIAILTGLAIGPAAIVLGTPAAPGKIWETPNEKGTELINRLSLAYIGRVAMGPAGGVKATFGQGGMVGTYAAIVGFGAHWLANVLGANRYLARMKLPVRI